jgi:hypothetical protein
LSTQHPIINGGRPHPRPGAGSLPSQVTIYGWSIKTHATQLAIETVLIPGPDGVEVRSGGRHVALLAFAAMMAWFLASQIEIGFHPFDGERTELGFQGDMEEFAMLGPRLNAFTVESEADIQ